MTAPKDIRCTLVRPVWSEAVDAAAFPAAHLLIASGFRRNARWDVGLKRDTAGHCAHLPLERVPGVFVNVSGIQALRQILLAAHRTARRREFAGIRHRRGVCRPKATRIRGIHGAPEMV